MSPPPASALSSGHGRTHTAAMPCVNAGLHGPGVVTRTGAGMLLFHLPARGTGGVSGKPPPTTPRSDHTTEETQAVVARPRPHKTGGVGVACFPRLKQPCLAHQLNTPCRAATLQQKAKGLRITSPVLLPLTAGDGR